MSTRQEWEDSEFPILCETCLGDNPYVRMTRQGYGKECKICGKPFTIFKWCPGAGMRYKKTEICQTCAKLKNACQTCILDLENGLPLQVRDTVLNTASEMPTSDINLQYYTQNMDKQLSHGAAVTSYGRVDSLARESLKRMARTEPYYKRNRPHICSFFVKGECKRGEECPYRHELPKENELIKQNIKDRYFGTNDPVAQRMLNRTNKAHKLKKPEDKSITSLFLTGIESDITEKDIRNFFYAFGEIKSVVIIYKSKCAFVNFATRSGAELAVEKAYNNCNINDHVIRVQWGKPKAQGPKSESNDTSKTEQTPSYNQLSYSDLSKMVPPPPPGAPGAQPVLYPSQDPTYLGNIPAKKTRN
jgi:pre-mRNA-splicing factor RBM22/SLT11